MLLPKSIELKQDDQFVYIRMSMPEFTMPLSAESEELYVNVEDSGEVVVKAGPYFIKMKFE